MKQPAITYQETYRRGTMKVAKEFLPELPHLTKGAKVISFELLKAGTLSDGTEFQNVRLIIQPPPK